MPKATQRGTRQDDGTRSSAQSIHRLEVVLEGSRPKISRKIEVPSTILVRQLHDVIQIAMGWENAHLFRFGDVDEPPTNLTLAKFAPAPGETFDYIYDFGDDWVHSVTVLGITERKTPLPHPRCTAGRRACPPEDCGGIDHYHHLLSLSPSTRRRREELGRGFKPELFDKDAVNEQLASWSAAHMQPPPPEPQREDRSSTSKERAAVYHRVSTVDQDPTAARRELRDAAKRYGLRITLDVEETGSGANNNRPGLTVRVNENETGWLKFREGRVRPRHGFRVG